MMKFGKQCSVVLLAAALGVGLVACDKREGPMEKAGKQVDQAADKAGQKVEQAGEKMQDAAKGEKKE